MKFSNIGIHLLYSLICTSIIVSSCDSPVGFTKPQPTSQRDLSSIPVAFRGIFLCDTDSALVKVNENTIYSEYTEVAFTPTQYIDEREDCTIVNDTLYKAGHKECAKVEYIKDGYIMATKVTRDTIFRLTPFQRARIHKGHLVLSQVTENDLWTIGLLELDGLRGITYRAIVDESALDRIEKITPVNDVLHNSDGQYPEYKITPNEVELDLLFSDPEIFVDCAYYRRVNVIE